jgi:hypothetical protein
LAALGPRVVGRRARARWQLLELEHLPTT